MAWYSLFVFDFLLFGGLLPGLSDAPLQLVDLLRSQGPLLLVLDYLRVYLLNLTEGLQFFDQFTPSLKFKGGGISAHPPLFLIYVIAPAIIHVL
jgi:hypothetical protein